MYLAITLARLEDFDNACSAYDKVWWTHIDTEMVERPACMIETRVHAGRDAAAKHVAAQALNDEEELRILLLQWPGLLGFEELQGRRVFFDIQPYIQTRSRPIFRQVQGFC